MGLVYRAWQIRAKRSPALHAADNRAGGAPTVIS
jgi:hypothetical protein